MILNFLQTRNPPVLPCLHNRPHQRLIGPDGKPSTFADDVLSLQTFGQKNKETLGELLFHFFRRYAHELDYEKYVISIREGMLISKEAKKWHLMQNNRLCVEEPFNIERNLGNTADDISFRGVHLELRRAFDLVCGAKLEECMEQYIFPAVEEKIWEKPPPKPTPILTPSHSGRGGRGGFGSRGARHGPNHYRTSHQGRRASSAATSNRYPNSHVMQHPQAVPKHPLQAQYEQLQLHDQLINEYQYLQAQEHELRRAQAQAQLLQIHGSNQADSPGQKPGRDPLARPTVNAQPPMSAPLQQAHLFYPYPMLPSPVGPVHAVHTNPSSPSMKPVQPELRRSANRSNTVNEVSGANLRSHSQPARPYQIGSALPNPHALLLNGYNLHQLRRQQQPNLYQQYEAQGRLRNPDISFRYDPRYEEHMPKEYVGYYVDDSPPPRRRPGDVSLARNHAYNEQAYNIMTAPDGLGRFHGPSRSPSPSPAVPSRDRSTSVRSADSAPPAPIFVDKTASSSSLRTSGPIIVDGSDAWYSTDYQRGADVSRPEGSFSQVSSIGSTAAVAEGISRRSGRSETIVSESGQHQPSWPLTPAEFRLFLDGRRSPNNESHRRPYPQVNGTAPAPATMRYTTVNGNGLGLSSQVSQSQSPVLSPHGDLVNENNDRLMAVSADKPRLEAPKATQDQPLKAALPLLSPVREVRTPSPTAHRKEDGSASSWSANKLAQRYQLQEIPPFSKGTNGRAKPNEPLTEKPNGKVTTIPNSPQTILPYSNGWQQSTSKKNKKHKAKGSTSLMTSSTIAETLPDNVCERKGG